QHIARDDGQRGHRHGPVERARFRPPRHTAAGHGRRRSAQRHTRNRDRPQHAGDCRHFLRHVRRPRSPAGRRLQRLYRETHRPAADHQPGAGHPRGKPMNILIAEDDENSRLLLEAILLSLGHTVLCAADGKQAWQMAQDGQPDLVITDILMPGMDGFELCRRLRRTDTLKQMPIIVYSATYVDRRDEQMALAAGPNRFIVKPIVPTAMVRQIEELADERPAPKESLYSESELNAMHVDRLQAKLRRKLIQLGRERMALRNSEERLRLAL